MGAQQLPQPHRLVTLDVPLPPLAAGHYEVRVLTEPLPGGLPALVRAPLRVWRADGCLPDAHTLCLHDGRYRVAATWTDHAERSGAAGALPLLDQDGSGLLWFFAPDNAELTLKVLDGCGVNGKVWVFLAAGSDVGYEVTVTDTATGAQRRYVNPRGTLPPLVSDTNAFHCDE